MDKDDGNILLNRTIQRFATLNQQNTQTCSLDIYVIISHLALLLFRSARYHYQGIKPL